MRKLITSEVEDEVSLCSTTSLAITGSLSEVGCLGFTGRKVFASGGAEDNFRDNQLDHWENQSKVREDEHLQKLTNHHKEASVESESASHCLAVHVRQSQPEFQVWLSEVH